MAENLAAENIIGGSGVLTVDLAALQHNYRVLKAAAHGAETAAVVKADAYGLGAAFVAPALYDAGCRLFFVAQLGEAFALQAALASRLPAKKSAKNADKAVIALLNDVLPHEAGPAAAAGFMPVLGSVDSAREWAALCRAQKRRLPAMLQCDSGMARLGLNSGEIKMLLAAPEIAQAMDIRAVISHLACADEEQSPMNAAQKARFAAEAALLAAALPPAPRRSLAASCGLALGADFCMDIVRPGLALYGFCSGGKKAEKLAAALRPAVTLEGRILRIGQVQKGETIGYGAAYKAAAPMQTAVIAVGYADGWPRSLGNKGAVYYRGARLPIAGRISMDCMVADLTPLQEADLPKRGDLAELIGAHQTPQAVAADAGTIAYEILTGLGRRYQRRYLPPAKRAGRCG